MKVIISGSRYFDDIKFFTETCIDIISKAQYYREVPTWKVEIISGGARGTDSLAGIFVANEGKAVKNHRITEFIPEWDNLVETALNPVWVGRGPYGEYNVLAGNNRNTRMAEYCRESGEYSILIAFNLGYNIPLSIDKKDRLYKFRSSGTKDMLKKAKIAKLDEIHNIDCSYYLPEAKKTVYGYVF